MKKTGNSGNARSKYIERKKKQKSKSFDLFCVQQIFHFIANTKRCLNNNISSCLVNTPRFIV